MGSHTIKKYIKTTAITASLLLGASLANEASAIAYVSNTTNGLWRIGSSWVPTGVPSFANGDTATILNGHKITSGTDKEGAHTVTVNPGGQLLVARKWMVNDLINNGSFQATGSAPEVYFIGNPGDPASFSGANPASFNKAFICGPGTNPPSLVGTGYFTLQNNMDIVNVYRVAADSFIEMGPGSSVTGISNPILGNYQYDAGAGIIYNTGGVFVPTREWLGTNEVSDDNRLPRNLLVKTGTSVNLDNTATNFRIANNMTIEMGARIDAPKNGNFVTIGGVISNSGIIGKRFDAGLASGVLIDFDIAGARMQFRAPSGLGPMTELKVERTANAGPGNDGTLTFEHYVVSSPQVPSGAALVGMSDLLLPTNGSIVFSNFPAILRGDTGSGFYRAIPTTMTSHVPPDVVFDSTGALTDVDKLGTFYINDGRVPLYVDLVSFEAIPSISGGPVSLIWETASEIDNVGFNVYRAVSDGNGGHLKGDKLNDLIIPAEGSAFQGAVYSFTDNTPLRYGQSRSYFIEDVDLDGTSALHGPAEASF